MRRYIVELLVTDDEKPKPLEIEKVKEIINNMDTTIAGVEFHVINIEERVK